jgi:O-acetyl-ADP-ribose deacetylase (regulator of RNase III)
MGFGGIMIKEVHGDILLSGAQAIAHGVSPNDNFAQGLALALREHWPALYKDFRHYCQTMHPKAGELWAWPTVDGQRIVNLMTQDAAYGQGAKPGQATLPNVNHALRALHKLVLEEKFTSLALPRLATGVGRLEWDDVRKLVDEHLGGLDIPVYVYTRYEKGVKALED